MAEAASGGENQGSDSISPTAHYTGETWVRNGLSHPELATWQGRVAHAAFALPLAASKLLGGPTLNGPLLARHRIIDALLEERIRGGIGQVVEVACGMSPRGWRLTERFDDLTYIEADLPAMARRKREALERMGSLNDRHRVAELDVLREGGPGSLESLVEGLDQARGLAIVSEGLLVYLDDETVSGLWARIANALERFDQGVYLSDLRFASQSRGIPERAFELILGTFVRGQIHAYPGDAASAEAELRDAGFEHVELHRADQHPAAADARDDPATSMISIIEAGCG